HLAIGRPFGGNQLGALRRTAVQKHHVGVFGVDLVETVPDQHVVVEFEPAGKGDLGAGRQHHLGVGAAFGGEKVAAVDHGGGERAMVDHRSGAGTPGRAGVDLEAFGGLVAEELHAV